MVKLVGWQLITCDSTETGKESSMWYAEHSMVEVHSQLCLVVPFLCGVDCMKPEGNVTNSCLLLPVCHQSNRGVHTLVWLRTLSIILSCSPSPLEFQKDRKDVISDWAMFGRAQETDCHFNHRISAWHVTGCSTLLHVWDHTAYDRWAMLVPV